MSPRSYRVQMSGQVGVGAERWDASIDAVSLLGDSVRRRVFAFAHGATEPVTREETAAAVGITRKLAAFHLDKLVDAGLLVSRSAHRTAHRRVGRVPNVYLPADVEVRISIPARQHELLADLLVEAVARAGVRDSVLRHGAGVARERGVAQGRAARASNQRDGSDGVDGIAAAALAEQGYEPVRSDDGSLRLRNCPFHPMAAESPELVCGLNHAYLSGLLEGLSVSGVEADLAPAAGSCCVVLRQTAVEGHRLGDDSA